MQTTIQHLYKQSNDDNSLFYAWFLAMHTRVDIILCSRKSEGELLLVVNRIYDALCRLEKMANFYDPASELSVVNRTAFVLSLIHILHGRIQFSVLFCQVFPKTIWSATKRFCKLILI